MARAGAFTVRQPNKPTGFTLGTQQYQSPVRSAPGPGRAGGGGGFIPTATPQAPRPAPGRPMPPPRPQPAPTGGGGGWTPPPPRGVPQQPPQQAQYGGGQAQYQPQQAQYQPYGGGAPSTGLYSQPTSMASQEGVAGQLSDVMKGFLDPNSAYFQRLMERMRGEIGEQTETSQRAAALRAAQGGLGGGASTELLATQGELGTAGLEAAGQAAGDLALRAPAMGLQFGGAAGGMYGDISRLQEGGRQFDVTAAQRQTELASQRELAAQNLASQRELAGRSLGLEERRTALAERAPSEDMQRQILMNLISQNYGGGGPVGGSRTTFSGWEG